MMYHVGQRVVCIDASEMWAGILPLEEGRVYTIRYVGQDSAGEWGFYLEEIKNVVDSSVGYEWGYRITRFRPVVDLGWAHTIVADVMDRPKVPA